MWNGRGVVLVVGGDFWLEIGLSFWRDKGVGVFSFFGFLEKIFFSWEVLWGKGWVLCLWFGGVREVGVCLGGFGMCR